MSPIRTALVLLVLAVLLAPLPAAAAVTFTDVAAEAGVLYLQHEPNESPNCIFGGFCEPERMTGGVAVGDADGDGDPDLFVTRLDDHDLLFSNRGDGTFQDVTEVAGLAAYDLQSNGAAFADIDNDGDLDLYVTTLGEEEAVPNHRFYLFVNRGDGRFDEEAVARGAAVATPEEHKGYGIGVGDYDRDGWLDLHTTEWAPRFPSHARLLRNRGAAQPGHFEDVTEAAGVQLDFTHGFSSQFADLDDDGWPDLAVAGDFGTSRLFWNDGDGTFTDGTDEAGVGTDENGMGSTIADLDGDGALDWFVTSIYDPEQTCEFFTCGWDYSGNRLYVNRDDRTFADGTDAAGVRDGRWGWGAAFFDADNDGRLDLVMTNGVDFPGTEIDALFNTDWTRLWANAGRRPMVPVAEAAGLEDRRSGKGLAVVDFDGDGDLDIFIANTNDEPRLYRNDGGDAAGDRLRVRTVGTDSNREGIGARLAVRRTPGGRIHVAEMASVSGFLGQSERVAHFGLGDTDGSVDAVAVRWPSGLVEVVRDVPANTVLVLVEGRGSCRAGAFDPVTHLAELPEPDADGDGVCDPPGE